MKRKQQLLRSLLAGLLALVSASAEEFNSLAEAMERFIALPHEAKAAMGRAGRQKVEAAFDRQLVVEAYRTELNTLHAKTPTKQKKHTEAPYEHRHP